MVAPAYRFGRWLRHVIIERPYVKAAVLRCAETRPRGTGPTGIWSPEDIHKVHKGSATSYLSESPSSDHRA